MVQAPLNVGTFWDRRSRSWSTGDVHNVQTLQVPAITWTHLPRAPSTIVCCVRLDVFVMLDPSMAFLDLGAHMYC